MSQYQRIRRRQILREAEGYIELLTVFAERWTPSAAARDRVAQRALDTLKRIPYAGSRRAEVLYLRGEALRTMQRYREAVRPLREASRLDPDNLQVWLALGWCYKRGDRLDLAIQSLEEALAVDSGEALIHYNLACYWSLAHNPKLAAAYLARAFDIDPDYRELVAKEIDFDPIRDHPEFQQVTSVIV